MAGLEDWIDRLAALDIIDVKGAAGLMAARRDSRRNCCYVVPVMDEPLGEPTDQYSGENVVQHVRQMVMVRVGVIYMLRDFSDARGEAQMETLDGIRDAVRQSLLGWMPPGAAGPVFLDGGEVLEPEAEIFLWEDLFRFQRLHTSAAGEA